MSSTLLIVLFFVLVGEFINGWTDAPNAIATVVSTRVMPIRWAIAMAVVFNVLGTLSGTAVANTVGKGIVEPSLINLHTIAAALLSIVVWGVIAARVGLPISKSHALLSGLAGAGFATGGAKALLFAGWIKVSLGLLCSTIAGFSLAWILGSVVQYFFANRPSAPSRRLFDWLQIFSSMFMAYNHGLNDGQKFVGVFVMTLVLGGKLQHFEIHFWVIALCAGVMGLGTMAGGRKIIGMLGEKMASIVSWQGFCAEMGASTVILVASVSGVPLSTTHTITTSIMGAAGSKRMSAVRWRFVFVIVKAWFFTFPFCAIIAYLIALLLKHIL